MSTANEQQNAIGNMLYPVQYGTVFDPQAILRAGAQAMGFGGINAHVALESGDRPAEHLAPSLGERALFASSQSTELILLAAPSVTALSKIAVRLQGETEWLSESEVGDLAAHQAAHLPAATPVRAAIVTSSPALLTRQLEELHRSLKDQSLTGGEIRTGKEPGGWWASQGMRGLRVGWLCPGQGSQQLNMARPIVERHGWAQDLVAAADRATKAYGVDRLSSLVYRPLDRAIDAGHRAEWARKLAETQVAQPAICLASALHAGFLTRIGLRPTFVCGHSLGELTALHFAGAYDFETLIRLAAERGQAMSKLTGQMSGGMVSLSCNRETATEIVRSMRGYVTIANVNGPRQTIVSGESGAIAEAIALAVSRGIQCQKLNVDGAFHSKFMAGAAERLRTFDFGTTLRSSLTVPLISSLTGELLPEGTHLAEHLAAQLVGPVDFIEAVKQMSRRGNLLLECGPGQVLSRLAAENLNPEGPRCLPLASRPDADSDLNQALAAVFVGGGHVDWNVVYEGRLVRRFVPPSKRTFIESPTERPFALDNPTRHQEVNPAQQVVQRNKTMPSNPPAVDIETMLRQAVASKTKFSLDQIQITSRFAEFRLDSPSTAEVITTVLSHLKLVGKLNSADFADKTLADVVNAIRALTGVDDRSVGSAESASQTPHGVSSSADQQVPSVSQVEGTSWVRDFGIEMVVTPGLSLKPQLSHSTLEVVTADADTGLVKALEQRFIEGGGHVVDQSNSGNSTATMGNKRWRMVILPHQAQQAGGRDGLTRIVNRLHAAVPHVGDDLEGVVFLQWGDGRFVTGAGPSWESSCAAAFARTMSLEHPRLKVRVIDLCNDIAADAAAGFVVTELAGDPGCVTVGYGSDGLRYQPRSIVLNPSKFTSRELSIGPDDVILATGGGRGITAECTLALAKATGARVALVGRSALKEDPTSETQRILKRCETENIVARYYVADVTDPLQVAEMMGKVCTELGPVTVLVHGAGVNNPRLLSQVQPHQALDEAAPKILGLENLLTVLDTQPPRLVVGLTSVIGVSGMNGNGWYAFANEATALMLLKWTSHRPYVQSVAIAYSVWNTVGMGARLGSVEKLSTRGIGSVSPDEGSRRFVNLALWNPGYSQVVVAGRLGDLPTWPRETNQPDPTLRFVDQVVACEPHVEASVRTRLTLQTDPYLADHDFQGKLYFPTVFGLEAMAEVAEHCAVGRLPPIKRAERVSLLWPLLVDPQEGLDIQINVEFDENDQQGDLRVRAAIRSAKSNYSQDHFSATLVYGQSTPSEPIEVEQTAPLAIESTVDLYGPLLFQGPRFQQIGHVLALDEKKVVFQCRSQSGSELSKTTFGTGSERRMVLGDPYIRDAMLQSIQLTIPRDVCLPIGIDQISLTTEARSSKGPSTVIADLQQLEEKQQGSRQVREYVGAVSLVDGQRVVEQISGYRVRVVNSLPGNPTACELANPGHRDEDRLLEKLNSASALCSVRLPVIALGYAPGLHGMSLEGRRKYEVPLVKQALARLPGGCALTAVSLDRRPSGKPELSGLDCHLDVSLSHDPNYVLCSVGGTAQGCDLQPTAPLESPWSDLLGNGQNSLLSTLTQGGDTAQEAGARTWAAREAFAKASQLREMPAIWVEQRHGATVLLGCEVSATRYSVLTLVMRLTQGGQRAIAIVVQPDQSEGKTPRVADPTGASSSPDSNSSQENASGRKRLSDVGPFCVQATLKDCSSATGRVAFTRWPLWAGTARELALAPIAARLLGDIKAGQLGLLTRAVRVQILAEAAPFDLIEARTCLLHREAHGFSIRLLFERVVNGRRDPLAAVDIELACITPSDRIPANLPDYLSQRLDQVAGEFESISIPQDRLQATEVGEPVWIMAPGDQPHTLLELDFQTTPEDGNGAGNIYFDEWFRLLGRAVDLFLHQANCGAEYLPVRADIQYLREAFPFDRIRVKLGLRQLNARGAELSVEFLRVRNDGGTDLLAIGHQDFLCVTRTGATVQSAVWNERTQQHFLHTAHSKTGSLEMGQG